VTDPTPTDDRVGFVSIDDDLIGYTDWWLAVSARRGRPLAGMLTLIRRLRDEVRALRDQHDTAARIIRRLLDGEHIMTGPGDTYWWVDPYDNETRLTDAERAVLAAVDRPPTGDKT
jgi:hypothetical protein